MRRLYINSLLMDLDDNTAIGIDFQAYDVKEPGKRKTNISNSFTIPKTITNLKNLGHPDNPQSTDTTIYSIMSCDYWIDNIHLIKSANIHIEEIGERIKLFIVYKNSIWDDLKAETWDNFTTNVLEFLYEEKGFPIVESSLSIASYTTDPDFGNFIADYIDITEGYLMIPLYVGNAYLDGTFRETTEEIVLNEVLDTAPPVKMKGGHICIFPKAIFEYIEWKYNVNFLTSVTDVSGNIFDHYSGGLIPIRDLVIKVDVCNLMGDCGTVLYGAPKGYAFGRADADYKFLPHEDLTDKPDKTLHDFVNAFLLINNAIVEDISYNGADAIFIGRFNSLETVAPVIDFGDNIDSSIVFKSSIPNFAQNNKILIKESYPGASEENGAVILTSLNKNIDYDTTLFKVDLYIPSYIHVAGTLYGNDIANLSIIESFNTFQFLTIGSYSEELITIRADMYSYNGFYINATTTKYLQTVSHMSLAANYTFLDTVINYPKAYTIKKRLTLSDIYNLRFFAQYFIKQLNGSFFISKISGYNPEKSNEPTTIELLKIGSRVPTPTYEDFFVDGDAVEFCDGDGNYYY